MTSHASTYREEQTNRRIYNDGNASDDSLLLMPDDREEKTPLLNGIDISPRTREHNLSTRSRSPSSHCHVPDDQFDYKARNRLILVLFICIIFMLIEIVGGILSRSIAVVTDAAHMAIDVASFLISLAAMYLSTKRPTQRLSFGYIRAEVLGALLSILFIWLITGILVYMAIERCINQKFDVDAPKMIIVSVCGVVFNIIMFLVLHANVCGKSIPHHGHSHDGNHGHSHGSNRENTDTIVDTDPLVVNIINGQSTEQVPPTNKDSKNLNVRAAIIHVIGDFVQSIGVLCAAILIYFKPDYKLADPICTFLFSVLVLITTITIMRDIVLVLMEGVPSNVNYARVVEDLLRIPGVRNAHSLHIWSLSMQRTALSVHIAIDSDRDCLTVLSQAQEMLRHEHSIARMTIQVESYDEHVMASCENCRQPSS